MFLIAGFVTRAEIGSVRSLARRFAAAAIGLVLVTGCSRTTSSAWCATCARSRRSRACSTSSCRTSEHGAGERRLQPHDERRRRAVDDHHAASSPIRSWCRRSRTLAARLGESVRLLPALQRDAGRVGDRHHQRASVSGTQRSRDRGEAVPVDAPPAAGGAGRARSRRRGRTSACRTSSWSSRRRVRCS